MEYEQFDTFARQFGDAGFSRRQTLHALGAILLGSALTGVAARLRLTGVAEAKPKHKNARSRHDRHHHVERNDRGQLHAEGNGNKKKKHKKPKPPPPLPPECQHCNDCQMCQDGACYRDPALEGVRCQGSGSNCGYCKGGQCAASAEPPCPDGVCRQRGQCCAGEKRCVDPESPTGWACVGEDDCCPGERRCASGCRPLSTCCDEDRPRCGPCDDVLCHHGTYTCVTQCCANQKPCPDGPCVGKYECCPGEQLCDDGSCVPSLDCCPNEKQCPSGVCVGKNACCPFEKQCPDGECIPEDQCCPNEAPPICGECEVAVCQLGSWGCQPQSGCCPAGGVVCPPVPEQYWPWPVPGIRLPAGCCRAEKMFTDPASGRPACAEPRSGGGAWFCD